MSAVELRNRPMLDEDLALMKTSAPANRLRKLVAEYALHALPVMNGNFRFSNLREGADQVLTCHPYRLWEYTSLFLERDAARPWKRALDVGGAASPLPYLLAEEGIETVALDLQPLLVSVCGYVGAARNLPLTATVADVTRVERPADGLYDVITFISVLEHIDPSLRPPIFAAFARLLAPGGLLYLTFDYGTYVERDVYRSGEGLPEHASSSIAQVEKICAMAEGAGLTFVGNDPRALPPDVLARRSAPRAQQVMKRHALNAGVFDAATPWSTIAKYLVKRLAPGLQRHSATRYEKHNFFRMFLRKGA